MFKIASILLATFFIQDSMGVFHKEVVNVKNRPIIVKPVKKVVKPPKPIVVIKPTTGKKGNKPEVANDDSEYTDVAISTTSNNQPDDVEIIDTGFTSVNNPTPSINQAISVVKSGDTSGEMPTVAENQEEEVDRCTTVADAANRNPQLSIMGRAIQSANLVDELDDPELIATVLFPTNTAFENLVNFLNASTGQLLVDPQIRNVVLYHIIPDVALLLKDLVDGATFTTRLMQNLSIDLKDGVKLIGGESVVLGTSTAKVVAKDIEVCKAVVHVIDELLLPNLDQLDLEGTGAAAGQQPAP